MRRLGLLILFAALAFPLAGGILGLFRRPELPAGFCRSNLRQLSAGLQMYSQDYDGYYPGAGEWDTLAWPYVKNEIAYRCREDVRAHRRAWEGTPRAKNSYAFNPNLDQRPVKSVPRPESTVALFESDLHVAGANGLSGAVASPPRHKGVNYFGFVDGHVKWQVTTADFGEPAP
jgi:prepilin-type processing-associated H-X9-DG protein